ncbi:phospholipase D-like domain-containing protein [Azohydromonas lata]|nr:hypothetical protein [Azohydromonas lata]
MASQHYSGPARRRERPYAELEIEHRHARVLTQCVGQPLSAGNRARWLEDPLPALLEAVSRTRQQLQMDQSLLRDAPTSLHQALLSAARRGVSFALRGGALLAPGAEALRRAGAVLGAPPRWRCWWPRREASLPLLVADGRWAFITPGGTRAPAMALEGPVVPALQQGFVQDWTRRLQPELPARRWRTLLPVAGQQQMAPAPPGHPQGALALRGALLQALGMAQFRIRLALGPGEKPGPVLLRLLCQAAWRGVDVQVLLSRPGRALKLLQRSGAACQWADAAPARADTPVPCGRAALAVVDGLWVTLGTPRLLDEPAPVLLDAEVGAQVELHFKRRFDAAGCTLTP